jgi:hypothetical protein
MRIDRAIRSREVADGLRVYRWLQARVRLRRFSKDPVFRSVFSDFYGLNMRPVAVRHAVLAELLRAPHRGRVSYGHMLCKLHKACGSVEASFASKIVASLDPGRPVIDRWVLHNTGVTLPRWGSPHRLRETARAYERLRRLCDQFLRTAAGKYLVRRFTARHRASGITEMKMLDFVLWQTR